MKSFKQHITEAFDKPYKWKDAGSSTPQGGIKDWQKGNFTGKKYAFETVDKRKVEVHIYEWDIIGPKQLLPPIPRNQGRYMEMHFAVQDPSDELGKALSDISPMLPRTDMRADISGGGDAMRIFATVLDVVQAYVKKNKPDIIRVIGVKTKDKEIGSRLKLYQKLVKRYAPKLGYKYDNKMATIGDMETPEGLQMSVMTLIRKGFEVYPKTPKITIRSRSGAVVPRHPR